MFYRVDVRSFADLDGDAIGDLDGLRTRLGYLELLGVDALAVGGVDLAAEFDTIELLLEEAHQAGIRVIVEGVTALRDWLELGIDGFHLEAADDAVRAVIAEFPDRVLVGDQLPFAGYLADAGFSAEDLADIIADGIALPARAPAWSLVGWGQRGRAPELPPAHARALALVELALPGAVCLQHGEELGLPGGHRTPMPWEGDQRPFGFSPAAGSWAAIPDEWVHRTVEAQLEDPASTLSLYRHALELRGDRDLGDDVEWFGAPQGCFAFRCTGDGLVCALNSTAAPVPLPPGQVLLTSGDPEVETTDTLPAFTAAWLT